MHSASGLPVVAFTCGSAKVLGRTDASTRMPLEPVSTVT
jgi:hypothetical protein